MALTEHWIGACYRVTAKPETSTVAPDYSQITQAALDKAVCVVGLATSAEDMYEKVRVALGVSALEFVWLQSVADIQSKANQGKVQEATVAKLEKITRRITNYIPLSIGVFDPMLTLEEVLEISHKEPKKKRVAPVVFQQTTWGALFDYTNPPLWAVIDGVSCREIASKLVSSDAQSCCLYSSTDPNTEAMAPWLVRLEQDSDITQWLMALSQDQHWGVLFHSIATMKQLRMHLKKFTMLWTPANLQAPVYFRFYDPRVALDMSQALESWKLGRFMAPMEALYVPISPAMILPKEQEALTELPLDASNGDCQGQLISIELLSDYKEDSNLKSFQVSEVEYQRFGELQIQKANRKIARSLLNSYPNREAELILHNVELARNLGEKYQMSSVKQVTTLAKCLLEFGLEIFRIFPNLQRILQDKSSPAWRKRNIIEEWLPHGQRAMAKQQASLSR